MDYSVIIPTHNRLSSLQEVITALEVQETCLEFEVLVVNDGSTDGTANWLDSYSGPLSFRGFHLVAGGPARARNHGAKQAVGRYLAFLGDDTAPSPHWLASHQITRERHEREEVAVLGHTDWHPRVKGNAFLDWMNNQGKQFGYNLIDQPQNVPFNFFYTSNLSVPRNLMLGSPFREDFPHAAWEDIEVGYRLVEQDGLRLVYQPQALVWHDHPTNLLKALERQRTVGASAVVFARHHPELSGWLRLLDTPLTGLLCRLKLVASIALAYLLQWTDVRWPWAWEKLLNFHYLVGMSRSMKRENNCPPHS
jgi:glycosyltransferase involved in cell wall biosynthesis